MSMSKIREGAIGIFDSGVGGLTIAKACADLLPREDIIYFGDTAHLPYGDKSATTIQNYAINISHFLIQKRCKCILIACNSASAAAYSALQVHFGHQMVFLNVIDPVVDYVCSNYSGQVIGLIGTKQTVYSRIYERKIYAEQQNILLKALATPLLAPVIEEGLGNHAITMELIKHYLSNRELEDIQALILGCTHYPIIKYVIDNFYHHRITLIDSTAIVAAALQQLLIDRQLSNLSERKGSRSFYVSDLTESFVYQAQNFFGDDVQLKNVTGENFEC